MLSRSGFAPRDLISVDDRAANIDAANAMGIRSILIAFEGLGSIEAWLSQRSAHVTYTRLFEFAKLPALTDVDFINALGGPMSVNDEEQLY